MVRRKNKLRRIEPSAVIAGAGGGALMGLEAGPVGFMAGTAAGAVVGAASSSILVPLAKKRRKK